MALTQNDPEASDHAGRVETHPSPEFIVSEQKEVIAKLKERIMTSINIFKDNYGDKDELGQYSQWNESQKWGYLGSLAERNITESSNVILGVFMTAIWELADESNEGGIKYLKEYLLSWLDHLNPNYPERHKWPLYSKLVRLYSQPDNSSAEPLDLCLGNEKKRIPFAETLNTFWLDKLDSNCSVCSKPFDVISDPPIRTVSNCRQKHSSSIHNCDASAHYRITNHHFGCLKDANITYVPVSHVWDAEISEAQNLRFPSDKAALALRSALKNLLESSVNAYGDETEFWYDYVSVPQWNRDIQQQLLLRLPSLYHLPEETLVHLDDVPSDNIEKLRSARKCENLSLSETIEVVAAVDSLLASHLMQRMWISLECSMSREASLLDSNCKIWRKATEVRYSFSSLLEDVQELLRRDLSKKAAAFANKWYTKDSVPSSGEDNPSCLGEVVLTISQKECRDPHDRFIAIHAVLGAGASPTTNQPFPPDDRICHFVWSEALKKGDYSPLLLQPLEEEKEASLAAWLVGHKCLSPKIWSLGRLRKSSERSISVTDSSVDIELDVVGTIHSINFVDMSEAADDSVTMLATIMSLFVATGTFSAHEFVSAINRIFPIDFDWLHWNGATFPPLTFAEFVREDPEFEAKLNSLLRNYGGQAEDLELRRTLAAQTLSLLQLDKELLPIRSGLGITRFRIAVNTTQNRYNRVTATREDKKSRYGNISHREKFWEPICGVKCLSCKSIFLFRLDLRTSAKTGALLYRIPSLRYQWSLDNGVGLVIQGNRIVGTMVSGTPACGCRGTERVVIK